MELSGVTVAVIGLGASGSAAARLALAKGAEVYVSDSCEDAAVAARGADLRVAGASVELGGHDVERVASAGLVVVSPGIPPDAPVLRALAEPAEQEQRDGHTHERVPQHKRSQRRAHEHVKQAVHVQYPVSALRSWALRVTRLSSSSSPT